jgi:hypothetical protein
MEGESRQRGAANYSEIPKVGLARPELPRDQHDRMRTEKRQPPAEIRIAGVRDDGCLGHGQKSRGGAHASTERSLVVVSMR